MTALAFFVTVRTTNPLNGGTGNSRLAGVMRTRARRKHREAARFATITAIRERALRAADLVPCVVTLTRISPGTMDTDGLAASQKGIRDGIADALGVNDGGPLVEWIYLQMKGRRGEYATHVKVERRGTVDVTCVQETVTNRP